jgi:acyl dehydratase
VERRLPLPLGEVDRGSEKTLKAARSPIHSPNTRGRPRSNRNRVIRGGPADRLVGTLAKTVWTSAAMNTFDPAAHRVVAAQRYFEDFQLGERFVLPSRTMTDAVFLAFQAASGDNHPVHYSVEYCRAHGMPGMLAHGFQTLIQTAAGAGVFPFMTEDSLIGFLEQSSRFLQPVFAGDTLYAALEVDEIAPNRTTGVVGLRSTVHNQRGDLVLEGRQRYLLRRRATAGRSA